MQSALRVNLSDKPLVTLAGHLSVAASIGGTSDNGSSTFHRADVALYQAKNSGRNLVRLDQMIY